MEKVIGEVRTFSVVLDYSDLVNAAAGTQDPVTIHEILPEGWEIYDVRVETETAFNGSGARTLDVGVTGSGDAIIDGLDIKAAAVKSPTPTSYRATAPIAVIANLITADDNPTAGKVRVTLFAVPARRES